MNRGKGGSSKRVYMDPSGFAGGMMTNGVVDAILTVYVSPIWDGCEGS